MLTTVRGGFAPQYSGGINAYSDTTAQTVTIGLEETVQIFDKTAVYLPAIAMNELGLYSFAEIGTDRKARYMWFNAPTSVLQKRKDGCQWLSKGRLTVGLQEQELCPIEVEQEFCPDMFWNSCFEKIFGTGVGIHDLLGTPEGRMFFEKIMMQIYKGIGNDNYMLWEFGQHPLIGRATTNNTYTVDAQAWADFANQQEACAGFVTLYDYYKDVEFKDNYNVSIDPADVSGSKYIGDALALIDKLIAQPTGEFATMLQSVGLNGFQPVIQVTSGIYNRLKEQIQTKFNHIPESYKWFINGRQLTYDINTISERYEMPNVICYNGYKIVNNTVWGIFDAKTGTTTHRAVLTMPGILGIAYDVQGLLNTQFSGMGLIFQKSQILKDKGRIDLYTTYRTGTAILDPDFVAMASLTLA